MAIRTNRPGVMPEVTLPLRAQFWTLPLCELNAREWEAMCDGCGRCCLVKLEDEDSGELAFTNLACRFLDLSLIHI